jgi:hypothetical protein
MNLRTGSIPNVACLAGITGAYPASWYVVDAIVQALSHWKTNQKRQRRCEAVLSRREDERL